MKVARSRRAKVLFNEASDYEGEKHSARGKPEYSGRKFPMIVASQFYGTNIP
jgi:hypothetical protein